jgi:hypothetical protein
MNRRVLFDAVQGTVYDAQAMNYVVNYDGNFDPAKIGTPWISERMAARMPVFRGIKTKIICCYCLIYDMLQRTLKSERNSSR